MNRVETLRWLKDIKTIKQGFYEYYNLRNKLWNKWVLTNNLSK